MPDPMSDLASLVRALRRLPVEAQALVTIAGTGVIRPERPDRLYAMYQALDRYGAFGAAISVAAIRDPDRIGLADDLGTLTFAEMDRRSNTVAHALRARGLGAGSAVGILCRNHRGIFDASFGAMKSGARAVYLNTDFAAPQAKEVCAREGVEAIVYDEEFTDVVKEVDTPRGRFVAWRDGHGGGGGTDPAVPFLGSLIAAGNPDPPPPPGQPGKVVILTSGTTGTPKGANRSEPRSLAATAAILSKIPFRSRECTFVAPPVFHAWGLGTAVLSIALGSTVVVRRRFDAEATLLALAEHRCTALSVVPVMLRRLVDLGTESVSATDLSSLRVIASSGSRLDASLATTAMAVFGDIVYNLYGSTEVAWATIATPADLRAAPGCAGRVPIGTTVRIYDDGDHEVPRGATGRIFVGNGMEFESYTGGGSKDVLDGLMSTGDVGHFDEDSRLFVDGRDDEMIVSGGENVFPREVEDLLASHESIAEAAAVGVDDERFGQRLRAFVVVKPGRSLQEKDVQDFVRQNLARYKVPKDVVFVDELPRNPSGKILKKELVEER